MTARGTIIAVGLMAVLALGGCANRTGTAEAIAAGAALRPSQVRTATFTLATWSRMRSPGEPLVVYIEGDGLAWLGRARVSPDPTPRDPLGLRLAATDPSPNVAYVARPCQYVDHSADGRCQPAYWTSHRFAEEVVAAIDAAIEHHRRRAGAAAVHLVGYSGGGALAVLVASRRSDVATVRTVAGNLDHHAVNRHHRVDQLHGSLDARDVAGALGSVPQIHYVGGRDTVVPPFVAEGYVRASGAGSCARVVRIDAASHDGGWAERWPDLAGRLPTCP